MHPRNSVCEPGRTDVSDRIAFIGLGQMGGLIAGHLVRAGFDVTVHDRDQARQQAWAEVYHARVASSCAAAAALPTPGNT